MFVAMSGAMMSGCRQRYSFANDTVEVSLENAVSIKLLEEFVGETFVLDISYFEELNLSEVRIGMPHATENVRRQLNGEQVTNPISTTTFRMSLSLILAEPSHRTVLRYVDIVNAREDVYWADVNAFGKIGI